ncbi:hypothetical protein [Paenibacillus sp. SI8]|uniref:hypothetical protein n=1 Tax=unclassified Paenibacillus TaxID=185978 RepID=UPI0034656526
MELSFDMSMLFLLLGLSGLLVGYYCHTQLAPLQHVNTFDRVAQLVVNQTQAPASFRLLRVRRKIPGLKARGQGLLGEEAPSSSFMNLRYS